ncbi:MAG: 4-hydroxy-tetrahydrodipicolinate synthase [Alphaproteobacteria bacterium]
MFKGSITALVTPFKNGEIDWPAFENIIEWQIEQGSHGLVPCGTTGESPTLTHDEHLAIVERCVRTVKGRVPVIAGSGSNSTAKTIELTRHAKQSGAAAALIVTPYYNKPTQEGLYQHYKAVHDAVSIPIIIYNIPGRSVIDMNVDTMARLAELPNIAGVKDATGDLERPPLLRHQAGEEFCQLTGNDGSSPAFLAQGGHGCISVAANIVPALSAQMQEAWMKGDFKTFAHVRDLLAPLWSAIFCETNPAPTKYALSRLDLCTDEVRLPMVKASANARKIVDAAMDHAGLNAGNTGKIRLHG